METLKQFGKNNGGYFGDTIDIKNILGEIRKIAKEHDWSEEIFFQKNDFDFVGLNRRGVESASVNKNIYISAGMHGDEPASPPAILELLKENKWPKDLNIWICPCLNPIGFTFNTRENEEKIDLNRDYKNPKTPEIQAHIKWLQNLPQFDTTLNLHEDWESPGFYILMPQEQDSIAAKIIERVEKIFPINKNLIIEGFDASNGVVSPKLNFEEREFWPEAFYLVRNKGGMHYTFEAGSDYPLKARVAALIEATKAAIEATFRVQFDKE
jgi:murein peptide amidase A